MLLFKIRIALKKNKIGYYTRNYLRQLLPTLFYRRRLSYWLKKAEQYDSKQLLQRLHYYNKLEKTATISGSATVLRDLKPWAHPKVYGFDFYEIARYFNQALKVHLLFGDITHVADVPSVQKSRPINERNQNAVVMKMEKKRHFFFIDDPVPFAEKKDLLLFRGTVTQPHRIQFMEKYFGSPLCDLGQINQTGGNAAWIKPKISIPEHLSYKFILSLEGNDVATNLKWIMSSNSIAVMPKPNFETWFMEGTLIPDHHYILIKDDYSDLGEKIQYYINNRPAAEKIVANANAYVQLFKNREMENALSILVLHKYFYCTGQLPDSPVPFYMKV